MKKVIFIRHGQTEYTEEVPYDLIPEGITSTVKTAKSLEKILPEEEDTLIISSPSVRAIGTAKIFLGQVGWNIENIEIDESIRTVDIKDPKAFFAYDAEHSTDVYGEMFFTDPYLQEDNDFAEGKNSIKKRMSHFLKNLVLELNDRDDKNNAIVFSHFEVISNLLLPFYKAQGENYPSIDNVALKNSEPVILHIDPDNNNISIKHRNNVFSLSLEDILN